MNFGRIQRFNSAFTIFDLFLPGGSSFCFFVCQMPRLFNGNVRHSVKLCILQWLKIFTKSPKTVETNIFFETVAIE